MTLLETNLSEIAMEAQFYHEEQSHNGFPLQGCRWLMEERMHRAQMEVSLFSTALVNLC